MKEFFLAIFALAVIGGLVWLGTENDVRLQRHYAPQLEQIRRDTFVESQAYNEGMLQELEHARLEYIKAPADQKAAIASLLQHQFASYDVNKLPPDDAQFLNQIRNPSPSEFH
jgi:hypothetical protein